MKRVIGIDFGVVDFAICSDGFKLPGIKGHKKLDQSGESILQLVKYVCDNADIVVVETLKGTQTVAHNINWFIHSLKRNRVAFGSNVRVVKVPIDYPSSKTCSVCGQKNKEKMMPSIRVFKCETCDIELDRDENAAMNLKQWYKGA